MLERNVGFALVLLTLFVVINGCGTSDPFDIPSEPVGMTELERRSDLRQALDFLNRMDEFDTRQAQNKIGYHLRQWIKKQPPNPEWVADPLARRLPKRYQPLVSETQLARFEIEPFDVQMLQEATWLRDVAQSVLRQESIPPDLQQRMDATISLVEPDRQTQLMHALRLFDWTVRNLQLEEMEQNGSRRFGSDLILQAWESLLMGRGTAEEKSRVFILLARQLGINVVMLGIADSEDAAPRPWLPAVLLGDQLFLLDMKLGLAIRGADGRGVATLDQVIDDPQLLSRMTGSAEQTYRVAPSDLRSIVAMIDATPGYLSQRMKVLEAALLGDQKLVLSTVPSALSTALRRCRGVSRVEIWSLPYEAFLQRSSLAADPARAAGLAREHALFDRRTPLIRARMLHFRGQFDNRDDRPGATALYLECRTPQSQIDQIGRALRSSSPQASESEPDSQGLGAALEEYMLRTKQNATYWLGLVAYDRGEYEVAIDYFEKRLLAIDAAGPWQAGAQYNLGRCQEAIGWRDDNLASLEQAVQTYRSLDEGPLAAGSQVRARLLAEQLVQTAASEN